MSTPPNPEQELPLQQPELLTTDHSAPSLSASLASAATSGDPSVQQVAAHRVKSVAAPDGVPVLASRGNWLVRWVQRDASVTLLPFRQNPPGRQVRWTLLGGGVLVIMIFVLTLLHFQGNDHQANGQPAGSGVAAAPPATGTPTLATSQQPTQTPIVAINTTATPAQPPTDVPGGNPAPTQVPTAPPPTPTPDHCVVWTNGPNGNTIDSKGNNYNVSTVLQGLFDSASGTFCGTFRTAARWWVPTSAFTQGTLTIQTFTYHEPGQIATNQGTDAVPFNEPANYLSPWQYGRAVAGRCAYGVGSVQAPSASAVVGPAPFSSGFTDASGNYVWCP